MKVEATVKVMTLYKGEQNIKKAEIYAETDEKGTLFWKIDGSNDIYHYPIGFYQDMGEALEVFNNIQYRLLLAQSQAA